MNEEKKTQVLSLQLEVLIHRVQLCFLMFFFFFFFHFSQVLTISDKTQLALHEVC